ICACGCCRTWSTGRAFRRDCCFRRLCRRTTDSLVFSYGASCKCDCRNSRLEFWTESLARLSEAFCCGAWQQGTKRCAAMRAWNGRRENDGHDRGVSRLTRDVPDAAGGEPSGKRDRDWPDRSVVPRGLEERSGKAREPPGTGDGAPIAMGDCEAIPVAAGNVFGDWSAGERVWETADCGLLASASRDRPLVARFQNHGQERK